MGKLACGDARTARSTLFYLACTQSADGGWSQNMWLDGTPNLNAIQMDGIALPILLADKLRLENALAGYSPYTMAVQVAALLAAADCADLRDAPEEAAFLRETADAWNDSIDELTYVQGTPLARQHRVHGY